jgi:UDP-N-acetylmuramoyl-L-alanyl-D-glutamate--2,6-diaminopimelate ligase
VSRSFSLREIAAVIPGARLLNDSVGAVVRSLTINSGAVEPGALFFAIPGSTRDGHDFIEDAKARGACAFVVSRQEALGSNPGIVVNDPRLALSAVADFWYGRPSQRLSLVGVTGTNGKTTTNWMVYSLLNLLNIKTFRMGTLGFFAPGVADDPDSLTSPDALAVHRDLALAEAGGCEAGVLEISSHALVQARMHHLKLSSAVFTNLTRDHLDYHKTMADYGAAKLRILDLMAHGGAARLVVNGDDPFAEQFVQQAKLKGCEAVSFGFSAGVDVQIFDLKNKAGQSSFTLKRGGVEYQISSPYIGEHNAQNVVGALLAVEALGISIEQQLEVLPKVTQVPGRLEYVGKEGVDVYVDYAHTPDALQNVLTVLKPLTKGKLWVVCGCGGDRDPGKRPQMARIASELADRAVFTSDNPRTEDPAKILADMTAEGVIPELLEVDRARAIEQTLTRAVAGDTVIIAGKGHEDYQIIGTTKYPFSDVNVVKKFFGRNQEER